VDVRAAAALGWVGVLSLLDLSLCALDKARARRGGRRVRERTLLGLALAGGSPGLILGMVVARHKTRKAAFLAPLALILLAQAALAWLVLFQ
jgi:uncharacterized membrane protein YsdA (DUF1294 family)